MSELIVLVSVAFGAGLTHLLENVARGQERKQQRRAHESQISTHAYALRRQLMSWIRDSHTAGTVEQWAKQVSVHFDTAEQRAHAVAAAAAEISSPRADAGRRALVLFYRATEDLNSAAAGDMWVWQERSTGELVTRPGELDAVRVTRDLLERCNDELEKAIDPELLSAEQDVFRDE